MGLTPFWIDGLYNTIDGFVKENWVPLKKQNVKENWKSFAPEIFDNQPRKMPDHHLMPELGTFCEMAWSKPMCGSYKMNIDTSFLDNGYGAAGVVLRNSSGEAIARCFYPLEHVL